MQFKSNISLRKAVSAFLLVIFVAIHVVKAFHHHSETASSDKSHPGACVVKPGSVCAICDYHFIKDGDTVSTFTVLQPQLTYLSVPFYYILPSTTFIGLSCADRGPPATV